MPRRSLSSALVRRDSITAAARIYTDVSPGNQNLRKVGRQSNANAWQSEIWDFYDMVPEFRAACGWVGNLLSKAKLEVRYNGEPTSDQNALDALASLFGGPDGQAEMLRLLGINFTATGEGWVVGIPSKKEDIWRVVAAIQIGEAVGRLTVESEPVPPNTLARRLWKPHPAKYNDTDCPARALMPTLAEIVRYDQVIAAQADSRLKGNGILWVPSELEMPAMPVTAEDENGEYVTTMQDVSVSSGITARLIKIASTAIQNRSSAAAGVPLVIAAPGEYLEKVNWTDFWTGFDKQIQKLREAATHRVGLGMDMPVEALEGMGDMNHWSSFNASDDAIKIHTEPLLEIIVSSLSVGYLQPFMAGSGDADPTGYTFHADTSALRTRPNRSKESLELYDRGELKGRTMLIENGFDPDNDAPDEKERIRWFLANLARKTSATPEQLAAVLGMLGVEGVPEGEDQRGEMGTPSLEQHPVRDMPDPDDSEAITASGSAPIIIDGLVLACEAHVYRALERAGNKLKAQVGPHVKVPAADLYLSMPDLGYAECERLLEDAWPALDRFAYPGVSTMQLRNALQEYTLMLLRAHKPMDRASLSRHLLLELSEVVAA